ncbi:MAG TPA: metalloprotease PmbA [Nevskiaceae bacterium]|nr:metalloprotease PmbA [Nevskiaceae bacterium]
MSALPAPLPERSSLESMVSRVLDAARKQGATQAEASVSYGHGLTVNVREGQPESVEFQTDRDLGITVYFGRRSGSASTSDWSEESIRQAVDAACAIARASSEDPCNGLADAERMAKAFPDLDLNHPWALGAEEAIEIARTGESSALALDKRLTRSEGASLDTRHGVSVYANTHGFVGERRGASHSLGVAVIAEDDDGMQRDDWFTSARRPQDLEATEAVGRKAGQRALARLGSRKLSTRTAPVLFTAEVARGLFGHFIGAISGGALYRRASFLLDHVGKQVFPSFLRIEQQPFLTRAAGSASFDQEGVATSERVLIDDGVLQGYVLGSYSARKLGLKSTGNAGGVFNLIVTPGKKSFDELVSDMGEGLIVIELLGQGVNTVTGDYSRGAAGFWVENGKIAHPAQELTIAGNLRDMFLGMQAVGSDVDTRGNIRSGSVLVDRMTIASG